MGCRLMLVFIITTFIKSGYAENNSRQKRCIVIQKQSGTHGDSSEADDGEDEYRKPIPKIPSDRLRMPDKDSENISPELLRYKILPIKMKTREQRLRDRLFRKYAS